MPNSARALILLLLLAGCSPPPPAPAPKKPAPKDESAMLPLTRRVSTHVVRDHMLGKDVLPGGTVGEYAAKGASYELFIIRTASNQQAAFLLLDYKKTIDNPKYLAHMGGYFGSDGGKPVYVFAKGVFLAGVIGLPQEPADALARDLAARLR